MTQLFQFILPELLSAAELEMDMDILVLMVEALGNVRASSHSPAHCSGSTANADGSRV